MTLIHRIQELDSHDSYFIGYVWRNILYYDESMRRKANGKMLEIVVNMWKLTLTVSWQWRKK